MMLRASPLLLLLVLLGCPGEGPSKPGSDVGPIVADGPGGTVDAQAGTSEGPKLVGDGKLTIVDAKPSSKADVKPWPKPDAKPAADGWSGTSDIGKACTSNTQCQFGFCAQNNHTGARFCTKICNRCDPQPCPPGSGCQNAGLAYICAPGYPNAPCP